MLSITVAEDEVRCVGLEMRLRKVCENKLSINSCVGVSFVTCNLCTFLLCLFRFIISLLVNDFYFNQFYLSTCTRYDISYFITISFCQHHYSCTILYWRFICNHQKLDQSKLFFISHLRYFLFFVTYINFSLSIHFVIASLLIRLVLHSSGIFSQFNFCCIFFKFESHKFSYNITINHN